MKETISKLTRVLRATWELRKKHLLWTALAMSVFHMAFVGWFEYQVGVRLDREGWHQGIAGHESVYAVGALTAVYFMIRWRGKMGHDGAQARCALWSAVALSLIFLLYAVGLWMGVFWLLLPVRFLQGFLLNFLFVSMLALFQGQIPKGGEAAQVRKKRAWLAVRTLGGVLASYWASKAGYTFAEYIPAPLWAGATVIAFTGIILLSVLALRLVDAMEKTPKKPMRSVPLRGWLMQALATLMVLACFWRWLNPVVISRRMKPPELRRQWAKVKQEWPSADKRRLFYLLLGVMGSITIFSEVVPDYFPQYMGERAMELAPLAQSVFGVATFVGTWVSSIIHPRFNVPSAFWGGWATVVSLLIIWSCESVWLLCTAFVIAGLTKGVVLTMLAECLFEKIGPEYLPTQQLAHGMAVLLGSSGFGMIVNELGLDRLWVVMAIVFALIPLVMLYTPVVRFRRVSRWRLRISVRCTFLLAEFVCPQGKKQEQTLPQVWTGFIQSIRQSPRKLGNASWQLLYWTGRLLQGILHRLSSQINRLLISGALVLMVKRGIQSR